MGKAQVAWFQYDNQNCFQIASIQSASLGYSVIIIGKLLVQKYGAGTAICSIIVGNLILWLIAMGIISMVDRTHSNAVDNVKSYVGKYGGMLFALILIFAILNWYALQISITMEEFDQLFQFDLDGKKDVVVRFGAALGLFSSLLSVGGIRLLKRMTVCILPLLIGYHIYNIFSSDLSLPLAGTWGISAPAVIYAILILLPGVINFPTFFRHSRSRAHSYLALTLMTVLITFFETTTMWMRFSNFPASPLVSNLVLTSVFIIMILTCCNLVNIYLSSAAWESIVPKFEGAKGYAIIGLMGTSVYTFVQISTPVRFLEDLTNSYIACLGVVLILAFLLKIIVKHRLRPFEKAINLSTWLFGCIVSTVYQVRHALQGVDALLAGINASILLFLCVIFIEETIWAIRKKLKLTALKNK